MPAQMTQAALAAISKRLKTMEVLLVQIRDKQLADSSQTPPPK